MRIPSSFRGFLGCEWGAAKLLHEVGSQKEKANVSLFFFIQLPSPEGGQAQPNRRS